MSEEVKPKPIRGGARPGSGRKSKFDEAELMAILDAGFPRTKRIDVIKAIADRAQAGDVAAASLLMSYAYGKPKQAVDVTSGGEKIKGYIGFDTDDV